MSRSTGTSAWRRTWTSTPRSRAWGAPSVGAVWPRRWSAASSPTSSTGSSAARRACAGHHRRPRGPDPRRAHPRPRPEADHRDPLAHQVARRSAHRDPLDAHPARGLHGVQRRGDHQPGVDRRAGPHRHARRPVLSHGAPGGGDRRATGGGARRDARDPGRGGGRRPGGDGRRRQGRGGVGAGARRARRDFRARLPAAVEPARAQAGGDDARGGLHPDRGRRAGRRRGPPMRIWPIFKKEMRLYFTSPIAYVVVAIFALIAGYFFYSIFAFFTLASMQSMMNPAMARELNVTDSVVRPLFSNISVILLLLIPLVTMRLFAEERRSGTIELLLTYPVRDGAVLAGKYLAALVLYALMLALTLLYPGIVVAFARLEWGPVATGYLGLLLMGSTFIAVGLFASALTENQIVASITTFGILLMLWIIGGRADYAGGAG